MGGGGAVCNTDCGRFAPMGDIIGIFQCIRPLRRIVAVVFDTVARTPAAASAAAATAAALVAAKAVSGIRVRI